MNRKTTNLIRFFFDGLLPPFLRNSRIFMYPFFFLWYNGKNVRRLMDFKLHLLNMTEAEYTGYYALFNALIRRKSDLNRKSEEFILSRIGLNREASIIDIGCGNGYLLGQLKQKGFKNLYGCDIMNRMEDDSIAFTKANLEHLPFEDKAFEVVICSHTLEHVLRPEAAISELKRIARHRLIITVPRQLFHRFTFDLHVNFFPEQFDLVRLLSIEHHECMLLDGDWSYAGYQ